MKIRDAVYAIEGVIHNSLFVSFEGLDSGKYRKTTHDNKTISLTGGVDFVCSISCVFLANLDERDRGGELKTPIHMDIDISIGCPQLQGCKKQIHIRQYNDQDGGPYRLLDSRNLRKLEDALDSIYEKAIRKINSNKNSDAKSGPHGAGYRIHY